MSLNIGVARDWGMCRYRLPT